MRNPVRLVLDWYHGLNIRLQIIVALIGTFGVITAALITGWFNRQTARVTTTTPTQGHTLNKQVTGGQVGGDIQASGNVDYSVSIYHGPNEQSGLSQTQRRQKTLMAISRHLENFQAAMQDIIEHHKTLIEKIGGDMNANNMYYSGRHLRLQYGQVRESQRTLNDSWLQCKRGIENGLFDAGMTEVADQKLKADYEEMERRKNDAMARVLSMTDEYFAARAAFNSQMVESAKKEIFEAQ